MRGWVGVWSGGRGVCVSADGGRCDGDAADGVGGWVGWGAGERGMAGWGGGGCGDGRGGVWVDGVGGGVGDPIRMRRLWWVRGRWRW